MNAWDLSPPNSGRGSSFDGWEATTAPIPVMSTNASPATETNACFGRRVTGSVGRAGAVQGAGGKGKCG
jgi:hypothetical protein